MYSETEDVIRALAENAESVCRAYLPAGRREGSYWIVGDLQNNPGRSLFVRLTESTSGPGAAGKFTDAATGEHGDLLDIIRERTGISRFPDLLVEARAYLGRPQPVPSDIPVPRKAKAPGASVCSLGTGRRHACRHLPPLPEPDPRRQDERPALPPQVLASG
jgi:hypothetical protein